MRMNSYLGQNIVSHVSFSGPENDIMVVTDPLIHIFYINSEGLLVTLFKDPLQEVTNSPARYYHVFNIPLDVPEGAWIFREVEARSANFEGILRDELDPLIVGPKPAAYQLDDLRKDVSKKAETFFGYFKEI